MQSAPDAAILDFGRRMYPQYMGKTAKKMIALSVGDQDAKLHLRNLPRTESLVQNLSLTKSKFMKDFALHNNIHP